MAVIDVKITDLDPIDKLKGTELFLVADPNLDADGNPIQNNFYTSNSISGGALSSAFKETLIREDLSVIGEWTISDLNQPQRFSYDTYKGILANRSKLRDMLALTGDYENSQYNNLKGQTLVDSLNKKYCYIPNFDYIHRLVGYIYDKLSTEIEEKHRYHPSYKGLVVFNSYTEMAQLTAKYGPNTVWEKIDLESNENVENYSINGSNVDVRLQTTYTTYKSEKSGNPCFKLVIPFDGHSVTSNFTGVNTAQTVYGFKLEDADIACIKSFKTTIKVAANTTYRGFYGLSVYNGNTCLASFSDTSNKYSKNNNWRNLTDNDPSYLKGFNKDSDSRLTRFLRAESKINGSTSGYDTLGVDGAGHKWDFSNTVKTYSFDMTESQNINISDLKLVIVGKLGWSDTGPGSSHENDTGDKAVLRTHHPYRARILITMDKITGQKQIKTDIGFKSHNINAWRRTDSNQPQ